MKKIVIVIFIMFFLKIVSICNDLKITEELRVALNINKDDCYQFEYNSIKKTINEIINEDLYRNYLNDSCIGNKIYDKNIYELLIEGIDRRNSNNIRDLSVYLLIKYLDKDYLFANTEYIKSKINITCYPELSIFLNLSKEEKDSLLQISSIFVRAYLGNKSAQKHIVASFNNEIDFKKKEDYSIKLGIISSSITIKALYNEFNKIGYLNNYNQYYSYKYFAIKGLSIAFPNIDLLNCEFDKFLRFNNLIKSDNIFLNYEKQNNHYLYLNKVRNWIISTNKIKINKIDKSSVLMITHAIEIE